MAATYVQSIALSSSDGVITVKRASRKLRALLWTLQGLLALIFVMTGGMKLLMPSELLEAQSPLPVIVVRFVGLCELAGGAGADPAARCGFDQR